ncbi:MAG TPA: TadE family type IV pilus minor pilin [Mycobacterium sp.]
MEAALGLASLVVVLVLCLAGLTAVSMQVRCVDAAREAARLAARGDERTAVVVAQGVAPAGATVRVRRDGGFVTAAVSARSRILPALAITAAAVAAVENPRR